MNASGDLTTVRERCGTGAVPYPELSPDGKVLVLPHLKVAVNVDSGEQTSLPELPDQASPLGVVFEDDRTVLALESAGYPGDSNRTRQLLKRCDVLTGTCETEFERLPNSDGPKVAIGRP